MSVTVQWSHCSSTLGQSNSKTEGTNENLNCFCSWKGIKHSASKTRSCLIKGIAWIDHINWMQCLLWIEGFAKYTFDIFTFKSLSACIIKLIKIYIYNAIKDCSLKQILLKYISWVSTQLSATAVFNTDNNKCYLSNKPTNKKHFWRLMWHERLE